MGGALGTRSAHALNFFVLSEPELLVLVEDLNKLAVDFEAELQKCVQCTVVPGKYAGNALLWKLGSKVRVRCSALPSSGCSGDSVDRLLSARSFFRFYTTLKCQVPILRLREPAPAGQASSVSIDSLISGFEPTASEIGDPDDQTCIICMNTTVDESLACGHSFCHTCIANWRSSSPTCPFCRQTTSEGDSFVLVSSANDAQPIEFEVGSYLAKLPPD